MAREVITILKDDIDGSEAAETVTFSLDGVSYEADLNEKHAKKLRDALAPFIEAGRRTGGRAARGSSSRTKNSDTAKIKAWADEQGMDYPARGRLPQTLVDAYHAANA